MSDCRSVRKVVIYARSGRSSTCNICTQSHLCFQEFALEEPEKPTREEYAIAKWLRKNVPTKKTKFLTHTVEFFTG